MKDRYGRANAKQVKKLDKIAQLVENLEPKYQVMTDGELQGQTQILKDRYANGETLDQLLPDAYAVCREASKRVLGQRHYHVQLLGGIALHQGRIAQLATGEGKTLMETLPAYLNALSGKGVHIVTVNEYLANRDKEWMGQVFRFLGLTVGVTLSRQLFNIKKAAYACDITYGTSSEFGFDYLRDNMALSREECVQRELNFVIVDEVDSILIDEARTPLIISGPSKESNTLYNEADKFVRKLKNSTNVDEEGKVIGSDTRFGGKFNNGETPEPDGDYVVDEKQKTVFLTERGIEKAEKEFGLDNLSSPENVDYNHYINNALRAHAIMHRDDDYIVEKGSVIIVDTFTGRKMEGRRFSDGLHQAIEAKEHVKINSEDRTIATITLQNYFRLYRKLSGMTGTAKTEENEFNTIYNIDIVAIPTNLPMIRQDRRDVFFATREAKLNSIVKEIAARHEKGQPILVGTKTVERSEELSKLLKEKNVPHMVLNAKNHKIEAEIIAQAGAVGAVTIATNMAGRGTDILLGGTDSALAAAQMRQTKHYSAKRNYTDEEVIVAVTENYSDVQLERMASEYKECLEKNLRGKLNDASAKNQTKIELEERDYLEREVVLAEMYATLSQEEISKLKAVYKDLLNSCADKVAEEKEKVISLGGLCVIGTERHDSRRIDDQLRGRAGRQGDPGMSVFFISAEDDMMRVFGGDMLKRALLISPNGDEPIESRLFSKAVEFAQKRIEGIHFASRKNVLQYDDVNNRQRKFIYSERNRIMDIKDEEDRTAAEQIHEEILKLVPEYCRNALEKSCGGEINVDEWNFDEVNAKLSAFFRFEQPILPRESITTARQACDLLIELTTRYLDERAEGLENVDDDELPFADAERYFLLNTISELWIEHVDALDELREGVGLQAIGQHDPLTVYKKEAFEMFDKLNENIAIQTVFNVLFKKVVTRRRDEEEPKINIVRVQKGKSLREQGKQDDRPLTEKEQRDLKYKKIQEERKKGKNNKK